jgi:hypothetical protein
MFGSRYKGDAMRSRKIRIIFFVIAFLVAAGAALMHIEFSNPGLKNAVTSRLSAALGVPVKMEKLSLKLSQGIKVKNLSLGADNTEILSAEGIILQCNFLKMLRKQFNVRSVVVEKPVFTLRKEQIGFLLLPLIAARQGSSSGDSGFQFQLAEARVRSGKVNIEREERGSITVDEIDLEVSSEGKGEPVKIKGAGTMQAFDFSVLGSYSAGEKSPVNFRITTDVDWSRMNETFSKLNLKVPASLKGEGKSAVDIILMGNPGELNINVISDLTENEISYGNILHKPSGFATKFKMNSVYSAGNLRFSSVNLELGKSRLSSSGSLDTKGKKLNLNVVSDSVNITELKQYIPALKGVEVGGEGKLRFEINKTGDGTPESNGKVEVKDWKYGNFAGEHLTCNIRSKSGRTNVDDIIAIIGEGRLTGSGEILQGGKYKFSIKGENIDMEKFLSIKEKDEVKLNMSGKAKMQAQISSSGGGLQGLNGGGSLQAQNGLIESFSWLEELFSTIHLPELMPFKYTEIIGSFGIKNGKVDIAEAAVHGKDAVIAAEEGEIDLVKKTKNISADLAIAPHLVERERAKFRDFDKFFFVDEDGFAHLSIVWRGPLSKGTPDLTASLLRTGIKKYGSDLLEKLFKKDED